MSTIESWPYNYVTITDLCLITGMLKKSCTETAEATARTQGNHLHPGTTVLTYKYHRPSACQSCQLDLQIVMVVPRVFNVKNFQTALRHWVPITRVPVKVNAIAQFSSRQICVDFYQQPVNALTPEESSEDVFVPSVSLNGDVETAGPSHKH